MKRIFAVMLSMMLLISLASCGKGAVSDQSSGNTVQTISDNQQTSSSPSQDPAVSDGTDQAVSTEPEPEVSVEPEPEVSADPKPASSAENVPAVSSGAALADKPVSDSVLALLDEITFYFSSGVGGWGTELTVSSDGSFEGCYHDSDMGDSGDDYPDGTVYTSVFEGTFTEPEKIDDYTYKMQISSISTEETPGTETITDGVRYIASDPYGLESAEDIYLYLPGKPVSELSEDYLSWANLYDSDENSVLDFYGIYNEAVGDGFVGYAD